MYRHMYIYIYIYMYVPLINGRIRGSIPFGGEVLYVLLLKRPNEMLKRLLYIEDYDILSLIKG